MAIKKLNKDEVATTENTTMTVETEVAEKKPVKVKPAKRRQKLPSDTLVECRNITMGKLTYKSYKQNGYKIVWNEPGDIEEIELGELMSMRNSQPKFFTKNWIEIEDPEILEYLGVTKYYKGVPNYDDFENIFLQPFEDMKVAIANLPQSIKKTLGIKATEMINNGTIDSVKTVKYLCEAFDLLIDE